MTNVYKKTRATVAKASAGTQTGTTGGKATTLAEDNTAQTLYDKGTRENNKELADLASENAQLKQNVENNKAITNKDDDLGSIYEATNTESRQKGIDSFKKAGENYQIDDSIVKEARNKQKQAEGTYKANIDAISQQFDAMNTETAAANASDLSNEIATHDITTPEGKKAISQYMDAYEEMLGEKYENYSNSYNRALMFNAVQNGLASAFGVPAIDFTQHPDVQQAKAQLDDMKQFLQNEKKTAGDYGKQKLDEGINARNKNTEQQQKLALEKLAIDKSNIDSARDIANGVELSTDMLNTNMKKKSKDDIYGIESTKGRMEEAKVQGRGAKAMEHGAMTWGESFMDKVPKVLDKASDKIFPKLF